jgi:hypothetical protein
MKKFFLNKNNIIVVFGNVAISDTLHNPLFDNTEFVTNMMRFMNMEETSENEEALKAYLLPLINSDFQLAQQNEVRKEQLMNVEGGIFEVKNSALYVKGIDISLPNSMITKFSEILDKNDPKLLNKYINFWKWLSLNPDAESREDMINWVTSQNLPILDSGLIMTFRRVLRVKGQNYDHIEFVTNLINKLRSDKKSTNVNYYGFTQDELRSFFQRYIDFVYPDYLDYYKTELEALKLKLDECEECDEDYEDEGYEDEDYFSPSLEDCEDDINDEIERHKSYYWSLHAALDKPLEFFNSIRKGFESHYKSKMEPKLPHWFDYILNHFEYLACDPYIDPKKQVFLYPNTVQGRNFIIDFSKSPITYSVYSLQESFNSLKDQDKEEPYFTDNHTRQEKYYVGKEARMPREEVDPNKNNQCSQGFHCAGKGFAYRGFGDTPVACLVNPKDVLVVYENDYGKCRTSAFTIVGVLNNDCEWADDAEILNEISRAYNYQLESLEKELAERSTVVGDPYYNRNKMTFMEDIISNTDYTTTVNRFNMLKSYVS